MKRARMSAGAGPYLFGAGGVLGAVGLILGSAFVPIFIAMALAAPLLQLPRQRAWLTQNHMLEFAALGAMPLLLALLAIVWLAPAGVLSVATILQGLSGFFTALGIFHMLTKAHTLRLADRIEAQDEAQV